jgi:hypothetical protein
VDGSDSDRIPVSDAVIVIILQQSVKVILAIALLACLLASQDLREDGILDVCHLDLRERRFVQVIRGGKGTQQLAPLFIFDLEFLGGSTPDGTVLFVGDCLAELKLEVGAFKEGR